MFSNYNIIGILLELPAILFALSIHEFAHAYAATRLGDETPGKYGRLTISPWAHIDPIGFICLLLLHFGWAKPVIIDPTAFKNPRRDEIIVSLAGPFSNMVSAILFGGILKLMMRFAPQLFAIENLGQPLFLMLVYFILLNLGLAVFNLLPIPPLDGSHLISVAIPDRYMNVKLAIFKYGSLFLIALIIAEIILNINLLPIEHVIAFLANLISHLFGLGIQF